MSPACRHPERRFSRESIALYVLRESKEDAINGETARGRCTHIVIKDLLPTSWFAVVLFRQRLHLLQEEGN